MSEHSFIKLRCVAWNIRGWKGEGTENKKIRSVKGEIEDFDMFILTETHLKKEDTEHFEKHFKEFFVYHAHAKELAGKRLGVTMGIRKKLTEEKRIEIDREKDDEGGRWMRMTLTGLTEEPLHTWGIYAPTQTAKDRKKWMRKVGREMKRKEGLRVIAGDFNFVMDTSLDKIGGNKKRGTEGRNEQLEWERELEVTDAWREDNPDTVATTWSSGDKKIEKRVKTRIDRTLIDERLRNRTTDIEIGKTKMSDHDKITWTIETRKKKNRIPYERIPTDMIKDEEYKKAVMRIFAEEIGRGLDGYESFKTRCVKKATEMRKKRKKKRNRKRHNLNKEIKKMKRIVNWIENARIQIEKGNKIKRWKRGEKMIRESNPMKWMGKRMGEEMDLREMEEKAEDHLDKLLEELNEGNAKKRRIEKNLEMLRQIQEEERTSKSFFNKIKNVYHSQEIHTLIEEYTEKDTEEKREVERRETTDLQRIATTFYKDLWKKRRVRNRNQNDLLGRITKTVKEEAKATGDKEITMMELKKIVKKMPTGKSPGIDGISAEFYQEFEFATEWLAEIYQEVIQKGKMTKTMRTSVVKLLFKKKDRKKIENYRPISLLCTDYKILAKITTERIKTMLKGVIGVEQQGFVKKGDIRGSLILIKEIIEYCNENNIEGNIIMMDFMKAYDRVDREIMIKTMRAMNFGEKLIKIVLVLYKDSQARVVMNGELGEAFKTEGGVRQGCPLSPYLFIVVLELMAIEMRESELIEGIKIREKEDRPEGQERKKITSRSHHLKQEDTKDDRISMFADDSSTFVSQAGQIRAARNIILNYERATGGKLHEDKTKILKLGRTRKENMTNKRLGVKFEIMQEGDRETYLGDVIGNEVQEEERFGEIIAKVTKTGENWNKEHIGIYGRAIIANTLMIAKIKHRSDVNALSKSLKKRILGEFRNFVWKGKEKKARVRWEILVMGEKEGGIGIKDPECTLDASKVKMLVRLMTRDRQPWMKWVERKLKIIAERWGVEEAMAAKATEKQIKNLRENCLVESSLKTWLEIGGTKGEGGQEIPGEQGEKKKLEKEEWQTGFGIYLRDEWIPIEELKSKQIYKILIGKRMKRKNYKPSKTHKIVSTIQRKLTAKERDYWWRVAHGLISTKKKESKWRRKENGEMTESTCPVCKEEEEDRKHYDYDCKVTKMLRERVAELAGRSTQQIEKEEWMLEKNVEEKLKLMIATVRWIYHKERCNIDNGKRRRMNLDTIMRKLDRRMEKTTDES